MDDGFQGRVEHFFDCFHISACIKEIADVQRFEPVIAVELFVVGVSDSLEFCFVCRGQHRFTIATEVRASHGNHMHLVACNECPQLIPQYVIRVAGNMMKLINSDQSIIKSLNPKFFYRKTEGSMGTNQHFVSTFQKLAHRTHLGFRNFWLIHARRITQVPLRGYFPIPIEAVLTQRLIGKAAANRALRHHDDGLLQALIVELVQRDEHQRT